MNPIPDQNGKDFRRAERRLRYKTMRISIAEGGFSLASLGLHAAFFIPFLNELGASSFQVGLGASLPALVLGCAQIVSPMLLHKAGSHRKYCMTTTLLHSTGFIPLALICLFPLADPVWMSIAVLSLAWIPFGLQMSAWADWMSHIVPRKRRGRFFARKTVVQTIVQLVVAITSGLLLDSVGGKVLLMFAIIWFVAFAGRAIAGILMGFQYEPSEIRELPRSTLSFGEFVKNIPSSMFGRFAVALGVLNFSVHLAAPFFPVHMINNLGYSYTQMTILQLIPTFIMIFAINMWGRISDRIGYVVPMRICALVVGALPLTWVLTDNFYILAVNQLMAGIAWAGFNLIAFNYSISAVDSKDRSTSLAYLNMINFGCVFAGATVGGLLSDHLPKIGMYEMQTLFLLSGLIRFGTQFLFMWLKDTERYAGPMGAVERFFFEPRWFARTGLGRFMVGTIKRQF